MNDKVVDWFQTHWLRLLGVVVLVVALFAIYAVPILPSNLTYSANEVNSHQFAGNIWNIIHNPSFSPYYFWVWLPIAFGQETLLWARVLSAIFATATVFLTYFVLRAIFSKRIALLSTLLIGASTAMLHASHLGTPDVMLLFGQAALFSTLPLYRHVWQRPALVYLFAVMLPLLLYIPGMIWFVGLWLVFQRKAVTELFAKLTPAHRAGVGTVMALLLIPAVFASIGHLATFLQLLAVPQHFPDLQELWLRTRNLFTGLAWRYPGGEGLALFRAPVLTLIEISLGLMGLAAQFKRPISKGNVFILISTLSLLLFVIIGGLSYIALMPVLYVLIAGGIYYLLTQWHRIFPSNVFARFIANTVILAMIAIVLVFHIRSFFVAWPHSPAAHRLFTHHIETRTPVDRGVSPSSFSY